MAFIFLYAENGTYIFFYFSYGKRDYIKVGKGGITDNNVTCKCTKEVRVSLGVFWFFSGLGGGLSAKGNCFFLPLGPF